MSSHSIQISFVCVALLFLASCTSFDSGLEGVSIRVLNNSDYLMEGVRVGGTSFGNVEKYELTDYIQVDHIYRTVGINLSFSGHSYTSITTDYVGETPIEIGSYTFILSAEDEYGTVAVNMAVGKPSAGDPRTGSLEKVIETRESHMAASGIELENGDIVIVGNKETRRIINPTISTVPNSKVRYLQNARGYITTNKEWLIKTDAQGNLIWSKPLEADFELRFSKKLLETSDGGFLIAGATTFFVDDDKQTWGVHLVKANADGRIEWTKIFAPGYFTITSDIKPAKDGGFIISGAQEGNTWLMKVTNNGNEEWQKSLNSSFPAESALPADNGYIVAGGRYGDNRSSPGGVAKTDLSGREAWSARYDAELWTVSRMAGGAVFVSGTSDRKAIALKIDANGNQEWMKEYPVFNKGGMHVVSADSHFVVAGQIDRKPAVFYVDREGQLIWSRKFPVDPLWKANTEDVLVSTADGNVLFIGNSIDYSGEGIYMAKVDLNGNILFDASF